MDYTFQRPHSNYKIEVTGEIKKKKGKSNNPHLYNKIHAQFTYSNFPDQVAYYIQCHDPGGRRYRSLKVIWNHIIAYVISFWLTTQSYKGTQFCRYVPQQRIVLKWFYLYTLLQHAK